MATKNHRIMEKSAKETSRKIATRFWTEVWNAPYRTETIDELVIEDGFKITTDGKSIEGRDNFKKWIIGLQSQVGDLKITPQEIIVADDGKRVITRIVSTGYNKGMFGTEPDNAPIEFTLISILEIENKKIIRHWVERSAFELHQRLTAKKDTQF